MTPAQQLEAISRRVHEMVAAQSRGIGDVLARLAKKGLCVTEPANWRPEQRRFIKRFWEDELKAVLTPVAVQSLHPCPLLPGLQLNVAALVTAGGDRDRAELVVTPAPGRFHRFVTLPTTGGVELARLEDVIIANIEDLLAGQNVVATAVFRITRDADVELADDAANDLLATMEKAVLDRRRRQPVRLAVSAQADAALRKRLVEWLELSPGEVYDVSGMLDAGALWEIATHSGFDNLKYPDWPPQPPRDLLDADDIYQAMQKRDILLFHPYERFDPVVDLLQRAANDPDVLAIKQTLYRTSGDSPIIKALAQAAQNGKEVTVLVELKARFDEVRNVGWARRLEDAGCLVIYGVAGYKTHSKALLIVRRESARIRRYVHLGTGNYNDKTAKLYSDLGLLTCDNDMAVDVAGFFNLLSGISEPAGWMDLTIAPIDMRRRFLELIEREIQVSTPDQPGGIDAKMNSLQDKEMIQALYRASQAGVRIRLNVRGICCLRPGVKGVSENIEVTSIVDRYLEHARIYYFRNAGHEDVYLSSADWMTRNLDKRLEILFPIKNTALQRRLRGILDTFFADNVKAWRLRSDGVYEKVQHRGEAVQAQAEFHRQALQAARSVRRVRGRFQPLKNPAAGEAIP